MNIIRTPIVRSESAEIEELRSELAKLWTFINEVVPPLVEIAKRVNASLPIPIPENMITIKEAAHAAHYSRPRMYHFYQRGIVNGMKQNARVLIDRDTLAACIAAYLAKRKTRKR